MIKFLIDHSEKSSVEFIKSIVNDVKNYTGTTPQSDDITALILKRN
jgi:serine phosphatase RsbU (regulator of sigma subunit)